MGLWIVAGFGFLFSLRAARASAEAKRPGLSLYPLWRDTLDLLASLLLLVTIYNFGKIWEVTAAAFPEYNALIFWIAAYLVGKYQKKPDLFFISAAVIAQAVVSVAPFWEVQSALILVLTSGIFIFQVLFKGLQFAMLFARVPAAMKGYPALCLLSFCLSVILSGLIFLMF